MEADNWLPYGLSPPGINLKLGPTKCRYTQVSKSFPFCPSITLWLALSISSRVACWCAGWFSFYLSESFCSHIIHSTFTGNIFLSSPLSTICVWRSTACQERLVNSSTNIFFFPLVWDRRSLFVVSFCKHQLPGLQASRDSAVSTLS